MGQAAARETDEIDQQRQSSPVMPGRNIHIDERIDGSPSILLLRAWLSIVMRLTEPVGPKNLRI